jgi:hypothetical protein
MLALLKAAASRDGAARMGTASMGLDARLDALKERHANLELRIAEEDHRPRPDSDALTRLKLEKLRLKEEIERLRDAHAQG